MRAAIKTLPDGEASAEGFMDNDGVELDRPVRFACTVRVKIDLITFDFTEELLPPVLKGRSIFGRR